jgi:hypothetical protein
VKSAARLVFGSPHSARLLRWEKSRGNLRENLTVEYDEIQRWRKQQPFQPFRVFVRDGRIYNVTHPRTTLLAATYVVIGILARDLRPPICDHTEYVRLDEIERIEAIPATALPRMI